MHGTASAMYGPSGPWKRTLWKGFTDRVTTSAMVYYTIFVKNLYNSTGYIDVSLEDDQLMKDFQQFLDINVRSHKTYKLASPAGIDGSGSFAINLTDVIAITIVPPHIRQMIVEEAIAAVAKAQ
jgi:hypothetical protein